MKHYHFEIQAYQNYEKIGDKGDFKFIDYSVVDIIEETEEKAIKKAKSLVKRNYYRLGRMYECHQSNIDFELEERIRMADLETRAKAVNLLKAIGGK